MTSSLDDRSCKRCRRQFPSKTSLERHQCGVGFTCQFCKITLSTEKYLFNHLCDLKRRFLQRDDKSTKVAFAAYERFYVRSMNRRKPITYDEFDRSPFYAAFIRFARHLIDLGAISPMQFVDFLLRVEAPIDRWTDPVMYATYIRELNKNESPADAVERNLMVMEQWSIESGEDWRDFFRKVAPALATGWIRSGKISPWLLCTASSAWILMDRLSEEQICIVNEAIDADYWQAKISRHQETVEAIRNTLSENGI